MGLTDAERAVLLLLADGHTIKSAAQALGISHGAVTERLRHARRKTGAGSSRALARQIGAAASHKIGDTKNGLAVPPGAPSAGEARTDRPSSLIGRISWMLLPLVFAFGVIDADRVMTGRSGPPHLVAQSPADGSVIAAGPVTVSVTFDRPMRRNSYSFVVIDPAAYPRCTGAPRQSTDGRSFALDCLLEPHRRYLIGINAGRFTNFVGASDGMPARPARLKFSTR